jgi:hypothetical protein
MDQNNMVKSRLGLLAAGLLCSSAVFAQNLTPQLKINGFATAGIAWLDKDSAGWGTNALGTPVYYDGAAYMQNSYGRAGITRDANTNFDSVLGLQFDYQVNDSTNLITQLVAKGQSQDGYKVQADWAYIRYALNDNWVARFGRVGFPGFMYSDSMLIGYAHPWVRPPTEVYANTPVPSVQGADITYRHDMNDWALSTQLMLGNAQTSDGRLTLQNVASLYFTLSRENFTLRAGHMNFTLQNNVSLAPLPNFNPTSNSNFSSIGMLYDDNDWLFASEVVQQKVASWPADFNAGYVTFGHYFGKFLPYVNYGNIHTLGSVDKTLNGINTRPSSVFAQSSYSAGLRFDPKPGFCLKAQVDHIMPSSTDGIFRFPSFPTATSTSGQTQLPGTGALGGAATLPALHSTNLFSLTASVAF